MAQLRIASRQARHAGGWAVAASIAVIAISLFALTGWAAGSELLIRLRTSYSAMMPSTAFLFFVLGTDVLWLLTGRKARKSALAVTIIALLVGAVALADIVLIVSDLASGVDALVWPEIDQNRLNSMAPGTAACFILAAACLLSLNGEGRRRDHFYVLSATAGLLVGMIAVVGYIFDAEALYRVSAFTAMALHTALCFVLLFTALILLRSDTGWAGLLMGEGGGSKGARRLFPIVLIAPFLLCLIALIVTEGGLLSSNFRLSLLAIVMMSLLAATVLRNAMIENATERKLIAAMDDLRRAVDDRDLLLRELYHRVKNNLQQINALVMMEAGKVSDESARNSFKATAARIHALGTVHRLLLSSPAPSRLKVHDFLEELCRNIAGSQGAAEREISIEVRASDDLIHIDSAVILGLIVNELVTNALKHAFPDGESGNISVLYTARSDGGARLCVSDNGAGMAAESADSLPGAGVGGRIVAGFVRQAGGEMSVENDQGARIMINLPPDFKKEPETGAS